MAKRKVTPSRKAPQNARESKPGEGAKAAAKTSARRFFQELGLAANERTLANKIAAGGFSAAFFLQCMKAIGVNTIYLADSSR